MLYGLKDIQMYHLCRSITYFTRKKGEVIPLVGRGIALLFHDRGTRRGWVISSTPWPHFTPRKEPVPILQEAGWASGPVWTGSKSRSHRDSIPDRPARSSVAIPTELRGPLILLVVMYNICLISRRSEFLLLVIHLVKLLFILAHPLFRIYIVSGN
jgi:hypothetical protein